MAKHYVYSTLTNSHYYTLWTRPDDVTKKPEPILSKDKGFPVYIKGGANLATAPEENQGRHTPKGVVTEITDDQLEYARRCKVFQRHEARGLILVISDKVDASQVAREHMTGRDNSAPLNPNSAEFHEVKPGQAEEEVVKPSTGPVEKTKDILRTGADTIGKMFR